MSKKKRKYITPKPSTYPPININQILPSTLSKMGIYYDIESIQREEARTELHSMVEPYNTPKWVASTPTPTHFPIPTVGTQAPGYMVHETNHCNGPLCWTGTGGEVTEVMNISRLVWVALTDADCSPNLHCEVTYSDLAALRDGDALMHGEVGDRVQGLWIDTWGVLYNGMGTVCHVSDCAVVPVLRCPGGCGW